MGTKSMVAVTGMALSALLLGGCIGQADYDRLHAQVDSLTDRNGVLQRERDAAIRDRDSAMAQLTRTESALQEMQRLNADLVKRLQDAGMSLADLQKRLEGIQLQALDPTTDALLQELASQFPDLIQYDPTRGMLRFASDLTFDSGSDVVKAEGREALAALASILKNPAAEPYDVIIVGHTDSQRISAGTAQRHPTNVHLSAHRSISVRRVLVDQGVTPGKMQVAGWGEFRPRVPNNPPRGDTPANRRVEIFLTRLKLDGGSGSTAPEGVDADAGGVNEAAPSRGRTPVRPAEITK